MDKGKLEELLKSARYIDFRAEVSEFPEDDAQKVLPIALAFLKANEKTAAAPMIVDAKPRMLQVTAWMCHADVPNRNGDGFTLADLEEVVEGGLFKAPFFGMIDFNHDFNSYGVWYDAKLAIDPRVGQWGVLITGAVFAWRYTELADKMLANMARYGFIDVSMACIPGHLEPATASDGTSYYLLRKPVFFTTSLLDVPPADPHSQGVVSEDTDSVPADREKTLLALDLSNLVTKTAWVLDPAVLLANTEGSMTKEELVALLKEAMADVSSDAFTRIADLLGKADKLTAAEADLKAANEKITAQETELANVEAARKALEDKLAEETLALNTAKTALEGADKRVAELEEENKTLSTFKAEVETKQAEAEKAERLAKRLEELPEVAIEALEKADNADEMKAHIAELDEAKWAVLRSALSLGKSYRTRSKDEGNLTNGGLPGSKGGHGIDKYFDKK